MMFAWMMLSLCTLMMNGRVEGVKQQQIPTFDTFSGCALQGTIDED